MPTTTNDHQAAPTQVPVETPKYRTPPGKRVLHLVIDQATFDLLHIQAIRSQMKFTAYMLRFLQEAIPYDGPESPSLVPTPPDPSPVPDHSISTPAAPSLLNIIK